MVHQALIYAASPGTHIYDSLQLDVPCFNDCLEWYIEEIDHSAAGWKQLDEANAKLNSQFDIQNSEILKLQDELTFSGEKQDFYRQQEKADLVPPFQRLLLDITDSDNALTSEQLFQQVLCDCDGFRICTLIMR